ncbi:HAD family hydrolase [Acetobacter senegalensis]|uniref:capsular biosynthesis protein n=1 Tax=Acetobacter senegalensis TaxID=446692 RepID=UPI001EDA3ACA|nr:capsular biosynthesis protein [Acetobacter senegalensis]MCG4272928.1 capsular biosynthesis protein [Acetobacter senegalensis]
MIGKDKVLVVDIDGTLCDIKAQEENYIDVAPEPQIVARLQKMHAEGWRIVLSSSRGMRSNDGNLGQINKIVGPVVLEWLERHNIPFDEIYFGKPWPGQEGFYIDDRSVRPREFIENDLAGVEALIARDRIAKG